MVDRAAYLRARQDLLENGGEPIIRAEQKYMQLFQKLIGDDAQILKRDFDLSSELYPFWANYPPEQRGRQPVGDSVPWIEVGQTSLTANITRLVVRSGLFGDVSFPGLPSGGDMRFATQDAFIHFDVKVTGPRDATDEVVASRNQISGDGINWDANGLVNSEVKVRTKRSIQPFRPELPPLYILGERRLVCLTYFLKAVYRIEQPGVQPLSYLELVCVPNGLLLFDGPRYCDNFPGLLSPGKDDSTVPLARRRRRVNLTPLAGIGRWRCVQFMLDDSDKARWVVRERSSPPVSNGLFAP